MAALASNAMLSVLLPGFWKCEAQKRMDAAERMGPSIRRMLDGGAATTGALSGEGVEFDLSDFRSSSLTVARP